MNIFKRIFSGTRNESQPFCISCPDYMYIVDATGLVNQHRKAENGQGNPRDHAAILKDLIRFASTEKIRLTAVFTGRPLREAEEGSEQRGVTVHYADTRDARIKKIILLVKKNMRKNSILVLTSDPQVENEARALDAQCMRLSTLKKAMENSGGKETPPTRKPAAERSQAQCPAPETTNKAPSTAEMRKAAVNSLIDQV